MTKLLIAILAFLVSGAVFVGYIRPTYDDIKKLDARVTEFDKALNKSRELQDLKQSLLSRYNTFGGADLDRLSHLLPDHVDNVRLVLDLDSLASRYGMAVQNVLISRDVDTQETSTVIGALTTQGIKYDSLTLQFTTRGTYGNLVAFLGDLENSLRVVDVVGLTLTPERTAENAEEGAEPIYRYDISLRTYWLK